MRYRFKKSDIGKTFICWILDHTENEHNDRLGLAEIRGRLEAYDRDRIVLAAWRWPFDPDYEGNRTRFALKRSGIQFVVEMAPVGRLPRIERGPDGITRFNL